MADQELLSISEVAADTGLQSSALRYYERQGLITAAARASGRRQYDPSVLQRLAAIALLQEAGFRIGEIAQLLGPDASRETWRSMAERRLEDIDAHMARVAAARELLVAALSCKCAGLDTCDLVSQRRGRHRSVLESLPLNPRGAGVRGQRPRGR